MADQNLNTDEPEQDAKPWLDHTPTGMTSHIGWLRGNEPNVPPASRPTYDKLMALPRNELGFVACDIRQTSGEEGIPFAENFPNYRNLIEQMHGGYQRRLAGAQSLGIPESRYREGIDDSGSDIAHQTAIGGLEQE